MCVREGEGERETEREMERERGERQRERVRVSFFLSFFPFSLTFLLSPEEKRDQA